MLLVLINPTSPPTRLAAPLPLTAPVAWEFVIVPPTGLPISAPIAPTNPPMKVCVSAPPSTTPVA